MILILLGLKKLHQRSNLGYISFVSCFDSCLCFYSNSFSGIFPAVYPPVIRRRSQRQILIQKSCSFFRLLCPNSPYPLHLFVLIILNIPSKPARASSCDVTITGPLQTIINYIVYSWQSRDLRCVLSLVEGLQLCSVIGRLVLPLTLLLVESWACWDSAVYKTVSPSVQMHCLP